MVRQAGQGQLASPSWRLLCSCHSLCETGTHPDSRSRYRYRCCCWLLPPSKGCLYGSSTTWLWCQGQRYAGMILWALAGETVSEGLKRVATVAATHGSQTLGKSALKKLPSQAFKQVNKALWPLLGKHLITKGPKGLLALGKLIPVAGQATGAIAGATVDWYFCHQAVDFAEKHVFGMIIKEEEELRNWLVDESFDSNIEELLVKKHHLDIESICEINKAELEELGLSIGHALRLRKKLFDQNGPCSGAKPAEELWALGTLAQNTKTIRTVAASCRDGFFQALCQQDLLGVNQKLYFPESVLFPIKSQSWFMVDVGVLSVSSCFPGRKVTIHSGSICVCTFVWPFFCGVSIFGFSRDSQHLPLGRAPLTWRECPSHTTFARPKGITGLPIFKQINVGIKSIQNMRNIRLGCSFLVRKRRLSWTVVRETQIRKVWFWMISWWLSPRAITIWLAEWENSFTEL